MAPKSRYCHVFGSNKHWAALGEKPENAPVTPLKIGMPFHYSAKPHRAASLIGPGRTKLDSVAIGIKTSCFFRKSGRQILDWVCSVRCKGRHGCRHAQVASGKCHAS